MSQFWIDTERIALQLSTTSQHRNIMGIKNLNQFVRRECQDAIKTVSLTDLTGKVIVIDASIYMHRFIADQALLENMYTMVSLLQMRGIVPVFVFDGKPPDEKRNLLNRRQHLKRVAERKYNMVRSQLETSCGRDEDTMHLLKTLRRRFIRVCDADFERVKMLLQALGVHYIVAPGEADALCAQMVLKRKAHACMSDDTDMFVYGCPRVLRHLNLLDETATLYDMSKILNLLGLSMTEFRQICVVSGTDYNCTNAATAANDTPFHLHLKLTLKLFKQYKKCIQEASSTDGIVATDFYTWLYHNCSTINPRLKFDYAAITAIDDMFDVAANARMKLPDCNKNANNRVIDCDLLHTVMAHENFIFV